MISFFVLTPPGGADPDHRSTRFIADRYAWVAFLFPGLWLLTKRCWLTGAIVLALQIGASVVANLPGYAIGGMAAELALALVIGLEGHHIHVNSLISKGWTLQDIVTATDLDTAEVMYFSALNEQAVTQPAPKADWSTRSAPAQASGWSAPALGLFDQDGGR